MQLRSASVFVLGALLACAALQTSALAQTREDCERDFKPQTGQPGKDVVWVPTNDALVIRMLDMAAVKPTDVVYDLGAGDGKIAIAAAKRFGARAVGVEYDADMAKYAQCLAKASGVANRARIVQGDIFETDFSDATVVTLYLLPELNLRLRPTLLDMKPGTRVVSHSFLMDDWEPDERSMTDDGHAYLWIVPARVDGVWRFTRAGDRKDQLVVQLEQKFQEVSGTAAGEPLTSGKVNGEQLTLSFNDRGGIAHLTGRVNGDRIEAKVKRGEKTTTYIGTRS